MTFSEMMVLLNSKFDGKKTYATAVVTILSAALAYFAGELTMFEALQLGIPALLASTLRHGLKTEAATAAASVVTPAS